MSNKQESTLPKWVRSRMTDKFKSLEVGSTFVIPVHEQTCSWEAFKVKVSRHNSKLKPKRFHSNRRADGAFEVYRSK